MKSLPLAAALVLLAACGGEPAEVSSPPAAESPPASVVEPAPLPVADVLHRGIDVSGFSGRVDWSEVKDAGHTFVFVKATEGMDLEDPLFEEHWSAARAAGLVRGAYHFYVTEDDPEKQARFFIDTVGDLEPGDLAPVVDVETLGHGTTPGLADRLERWLEIVEARYGVKPIIYTSPDFWNEHLDDRFGDHPLWIAQYGVDEPRLPEGWDIWHLWQWKADAEVPGVEKGADLSHLNRAIVDLSDLLVPPVSKDRA